MGKADVEDAADALPPACEPEGEAVVNAVPESSGDAEMVAASPVGDVNIEALIAPLVLPSGVAVTAEALEHGEGRGVVETLGLGAPVTVSAATEGVFVAVTVEMAVPSAEEEMEGTTGVIVAADVDEACS